MSVSPLQPTRASQERQTHTFFVARWGWFGYCSAPVLSSAVLWQYGQITDMNHFSRLAEAGRAVRMCPCASPPWLNRTLRA